MQCSETPQKIQFTLPTTQTPAALPQVLLQGGYGAGASHASKLVPKSSETRSLRTYMENPRLQHKQPTWHLGKKQQQTAMHKLILCANGNGLELFDNTTVHAISVNSFETLVQSLRPARATKLLRSPPRQHLHQIPGRCNVPTDTDTDRQAVFPS